MTAEILTYEAQSIFEKIWIQVLQLGPYWAVGLAAGSFVSVYLSQRIVDRICMLAESTAPFVSIFAAAIWGVASPLCMYGTVPLLAALGQKQVPQSAIAAFMVSSILLNPNLFLLSFALGAPVAFLRLALCLIAGTLAGLLTHMFFKNKSLFNFTGFQTETVCRQKTYFRDLAKAIRITGPYFGAGILLTALYTQLFPQAWMDALFIQNRGFGVLLSVSLSVPLYACGGGTIPLLYAWTQEGMSLGSTVAFMIAGPATKITNLGAVKIILGPRNFLLYLGYSLLFSFICGWAMDFFMLTGGGK